ncbi:tRNA/rRNA methyltransferase [Trema orientale]|uniref:tRNA/rRNA methyltransferase n=1 Tax=Trema orientale TaxID=63057 RepID=A0A2P5EL71_TREOI|nr:tRNA/rRNA methyltransferase [Trema orientale]
MEASALKTLAAPLWPIPHFRSTTVPLFRCLNLNLNLPPRRPLHLSFCSLGTQTSVPHHPHGLGEALTSSDLSHSHSHHHNILQVVLVSPQVADNLLKDGSEICIILGRFQETQGALPEHPLGFQVDDAKLKRAGLDYWPFVVVKVHNSWAEFKHYFTQQAGEKRLLAFTKRGTNVHSDFSYRRGDYLVFGSETCGLPPEALQDCKSEEFGGGTVRIPMVETYVRCLNLSVSVGIALYEASRQLNYQQLQFPSENYSDSEQSFVTEDIFA